MMKILVMLISEDDEVLTCLFAHMMRSSHHQTLTLCITHMDADPQALVYLHLPPTYLEGNKTA